MICEGWEGLTVDGRFPLLEWLGGWADRCVFLTVRQSTHTANIKLIQVSGAEADACVARWEAAKALPHPCLVEMMETGRYRLNDTDVAYVVTEKADTFLSGIVPRKAINTSELQEILLPVVDALAFVHEKGFVHGSVKPSSIELINQEWKLSSDEMARAGEPLKLNREFDTYDAPELSTGAITPAADMWSLGMIIVEACSQRTPVWDRNMPGDLGVPDWLPQPFQEIARECIRWDPATRISTAKVKELLTRTAVHAPAATVTSTREPEARRAAAAAAVAEAPVSTLSERVAAVRAAEPDELRPAPRNLFEDEPGELTPRTPRLFGDLGEEEERPSRTGPVLFTLFVLLVIAAIFGIRYKDRIMPLIAKRSMPAQTQQTPETEAPQNPAGAAKPETAAKPDQEPPLTTTQSSSPPADQPAGTGTPAQTPAPQTPTTDTANTPAQPTPQAQPPAETAEATPQPATEPTPPPKPEAKKASAAPRVMNAKGAVLKRVLPRVSPGAIESMRRPVQVDVRVSVNSNGSVSSAQSVTQSRGNYWARISQQAAEGWKFKAPVTDGKARDSYWMLLFQYNRGRTDVVATELR